MGVLSRSLIHSLDHSLSVRLTAHLPGPDILVGAVSNCAYPVRLEWDLYHTRENGIGVKLAGSGESLGW